MKPCQSVLMVSHPSLSLWYVSLSTSDIYWSPKSLLHAISTWSCHGAVVSASFYLSFIGVLCFYRCCVSSCVPVLLLSLIFPPHLPCISFISPVLFPVLFSAHQLLPALLLPPLIPLTCVSPPLSTCTSSPCYFSLNLNPVIGSVFVKRSCSCSCFYHE